MFRYKQDVSVKAGVLKALQETKAGNKILSFGICGNVKSKMPGFAQLHASDLLHQLFRRWPEFSGTIEFPIRVKPSEDSSTMQYHKHREHCWNKRYKYVKARYRLLDFCIAELEQDPDLVSK